MTRQYKILLVLLAVAIVAVLYLIINSKPVNDVEKQVVNEPQKVEKVEKVDLVKLENDYKENFKEIFTNYVLALQDMDLSVDKAVFIKKQVLDLRVPTNFKDLHLDFVLAITKMENFLTDDDEKEKEEGQRIVDEIKVNYEWLN